MHIFTELPPFEAASCRDEQLIAAWSHLTSEMQQCIVTCAAKTWPKSVKCF